MRSGSPGAPPDRAYVAVMTVILVGLALVLVILFSIARVLFGAATAVLLTGAVGYCFGGPPAAGAGIIAGLVLAPITWVLGAALDPSRD
jgi:hypothetical protein